MSLESWSGLPPEIIDLIFNRIISSADRVRFRAVCKWWRSAVPTAAAHPYAPPYLYFVLTRKMYCMLEKRKYRVPLMQDKSDCNLYGSSNDWLSLVDSQGHVFAFNPFSGARVDFPALWTLPDVKTVSSSNRIYSLSPEGTELGIECLRRSLTIGKLTVSPTKKAVMIYRRGTKLAFAGPASECWTQVDVPHDFPPPAFRSAVYHDSRFYVTNLNGATICIDVGRGSVETIVPEDTIEPDFTWGGPYLLSLPTGELLWVCTTFKKPRKIKTVRFAVLKLVRNESGSAATWERVERLDDWTIFLNMGGPWARSSKETVGCKGNCIYFSFHYSVQWKGKKQIFSENGIFDVSDKSVQTICSSKGDRAYSLWIEPKIID